MTRLLGVPVLKGPILIDLSATWAGKLHLSGPIQGWRREIGVGITHIKARRERTQRSLLASAFRGVVPRHVSR